MDLIGSVTGEVIEVNKVPVLAIPENVPFEDLSEAKNIAFATSFNQRDWWHSMSLWKSSNRTMPHSFVQYLDK